MSSDGSPSEPWQYCGLLPNLRVNEPIGNDVVALVAFDDSRLQELGRRNAALMALLQGFTDQFQRPRRPSAIVARQPLPPCAVIDFRNVVAISCIIGAAQMARLCVPPISSVWPVKFADHFDLYPLSPVTLPGKGLLTNSYAGVGTDHDVDKFRGQTSPRLHNVEAALPIPDAFVLDELMAAWMGMYMECLSVDNRVMGLFRSLQVAFHAATQLSKNEASIHDFGVCVSQWVSAMEILLHPTNGETINERRVLGLLGTYPWQAPILQQLQATLPASGKGRPAIPLNAVQFLYHQVYMTRNDFAHGNDISNAPYHSPFENLQGPGWLVVAPLIFKAALSCFLERYDASSVLDESIVAILPTPSKGNAP